MSSNSRDHRFRLPRREFLSAVGVAAGAAALRPSGLLGAAEGASDAASRRSAKTPAAIRAAFLYPSTESLKAAGYYSWPGSGFDAEGHHRQYAQRVGESAGKLGVNLTIEPRRLSEPETIEQFIGSVKETKPDGLLLVAFKKSEWPSVVRIVRETGVPTVAMATLGVLLKDHINEMLNAPGVYTISSLDDFDAIEYGLRMIRTARWMREARILSIAGTEAKEMTVAHLGTQIRVVPTQRIVDVFAATPVDDAVRQMARRYLDGAKARREPTDDDVVQAARATLAVRRLMEQEQADALMMDCLGPLAKRQFVAPCLGFMDLRDEGIVAGCQNDLQATLTMMLMQQLFDRPGFQQNASFDSEKGLYFAAHCTCPTRMQGPAGPAEPYILRNHAEAGVGAVPQVLFPEGREVTVASYKVGELPEMSIYTGRIVGCLDTPPAGGCRTNVLVALDGVDPSTMHAGFGGHQNMFYGHHARPLRAFCQMYGIAVMA